ncbi:MULTISPECIES: hypothetical protein [Persicobacter]|uniref:Membrane protein n=1 Tax=Persicobacter diffluens TaxID=981 RepID=A0AAN5AID4_9BACT|nr:hypothetical protein [Persicobacter sp. CCB-QB2]GJM59697.1 membrane protein [Persicobacter diffluens]
MLKNRYSLFGLILFCWFFAADLKAQVAQTPYSSLGVGNLMPQGYVSNLGKGGVGIASSAPWFINNLNPALLANNTSTLIEVGGFYEGRKVEDGEFSQYSSTGNLSYISIAFPVMFNRWTMNFGFNPYSAVNYRINQGTVGVMDGPMAPDGSPYIYKSRELRGDGGLRSAYWANGVRLNKNFSLGIKASYLFGFYTREQISRYYDERAFDLDPDIAEEAFAFNYLTAYQNVIEVSDFSFQLGGRYKGKLAEKTYINVGATYDFRADLSGNNEVVLERRVSTENPYDEQVFRQQISNDPDFETIIPAKLGLGVSLEKDYKYSIAVDFTQQDWSAYASHIESSTNAVSMGNSYRVAVGGEYIPDFFSVRNYLSRVAYRAGFFYEQTPYLMVDANGGTTSVTNMAVSAGATFPIGYNSLSLAGVAGVRDAAVEGAFRETYFQLSVGVTFSERWFIRRKYD